MRRAKQTFLATVKPMLEQADVEHEVIGETRGAGRGEGGGGGGRLEDLRRGGQRSRKLRKTFKYGWIIHVCVPGCVWPIRRGLTVTERRNHARDHVKAMKGDVAGQWDGMVVIGGDGLLYEVINVREDEAWPSSSTPLSAGV